MSWLFSQALVAEYLGESFSDGEQSAPLNGNPIQQAYCAPDKMTDFSRLSRFGMTYKPLTESRGEELLTLYREDFHAKTFPQQEKAMDLTENDPECGDTWRGWLAKYDPDTSSWKTPQCSLLEEEQESLEILPKWGMTVAGRLWELQTLEPITKGTECGSLGNLPTPTASQMPCEGTVRLMRKAWLNGEFTLEEASVIAGRDVRKAQGKVPKWASPNARDWKDSGASQGNRKSPNLGTQVHWPTPRTKGMCGGSGSWDLLNKNTTVEEARQMGAGNGGKLNPTWVEWLMGWPLGWTDLKPLVTDKYHSVQQKPGDS
jgi:hypothetical protein